MHLGEAHSVGTASPFGHVCESDDWQSRLNNQTLAAAARLEAHETALLAASFGRAGISPKNRKHPQFVDYDSEDELPPEEVPSGNRIGSTNIFAIIEHPKVPEDCRYYTFRHPSDLPSSYLRINCTPFNGRRGYYLRASNSSGHVTAGSILKALHIQGSEILRNPTRVIVLDPREYPNMQLSYVTGTFRRVFGIHRHNYIFTSVSPVPYSDPNVTTHSISSAYCQNPNPEFEAIYEARMPTVVENEEHPPDFDVTMAQTFVDDAFRGRTMANQSYDAFLMSIGTIDLPEGQTSTVPHKAPYDFAKFDNLTPVLKTPMPHPRAHTQKEMIYAAEKRNASAPLLQTTIEPRRAARRLWRKFKKAYVSHPEMFEPPITISELDTQLWARDQDNLNTKDLLWDGPEFAAMNVYDFALKKDPKPKLTPDAQDTYVAPQTIASHSKAINAFFCPAWREVKKRFLKMLRKDVKIFSDCSVDDFQDQLDFSVGNQRFAVFVGDDNGVKLRVTTTKSNGELVVFEIDISKYDKSQNQIALEFEILMMKEFGMPPSYIEYWRRAHMLTTLKDRTTGLLMHLWYQRKSGDASTLFGNTAFLMAVVNDVFGIEKMMSGRVKKITPQQVEQMAERYNLEVKLLQYDHMYFSSRFIFEVNDKWIIVPDPVKLAVKLAKHNVVNWAHLEETRISLEDLVRPFASLAVCTLLAKALVQRYNMRCDYLNFLHSLATVARADLFKQLYYQREDAVIDVNRIMFSRK